jgi:uncharacterized SAM-binding protein YcdF (DUF218 family)
MSKKLMLQNAGENNRRSLGCIKWSSCLLAVPVGLVALYLLLVAAGSFLIHGDALKPSDAVVALGGGSEGRVAESVDLIHDHYGQWFILTEPGEVEPGGGMGSQFFRTVAIEQGLSEHAIYITEGVQGNTHDEATAVMRLMQKHQMKSVIVVTDPFHTMRTRIIFRDVFRGSGLEVRVHPVQGHWYRGGTWFLSRAGWANTLREYAKLFGYWLGIYQTLD